MDDSQKQKFKGILDWIHGSNEFVYSKNVNTQKLYDWLNNDRVLELSGDELKKFFKDIDKFKYLKNLFNQLSENNLGNFEGIAGLFSNGGNEKLRTTIGYLNKLTSYLNDENILKIKKIDESSEQKYKLISKLELLPKKIYDYALKELGEEKISVTKTRSSITVDFENFEQANKFFSYISNNTEKFPNVKLVIEIKKNLQVDYTEIDLANYFNKEANTKLQEMKKEPVLGGKNKNIGGNQLSIF
jgi:hypothetical protein